MSGIKPFFVTGAKVKIKLNGKTIAFATDFTCSIQVLHQTPHVLGMYEGVSVEPLSYNVGGSFAIIRYVHNAEANINGAPPGVAANDAGNGVGNWGSVWGGGILSNLPSTIGNPFAGGTDGRADTALDPSSYSQGTTFDIEVYQHNPSGDPLGVIKVRQVRISRADFNVSKRTPGMDKFEFVGLYVDGDAYVANPSGTGQQNA